VTPSVPTGKRRQGCAARDACRAKPFWTLRAYRSGITGIHFNGGDFVTRGFTGEISRWNVSKLLSAETIDRAVLCLALRFDEDTGGLMEQAPACDLP
jgi:hypothetical protein